MRFVRAATVLVILGLGWGLYHVVSSERFVDPTLVDLDLNSRVIVNSRIDESSLVTYGYLAERLPEKLTDTEIIELRRGNSYTELVDVSVPGDDPLLKVETIFYSQAQFAQDEDGEWYQVEYATTTVGAWRYRFRPHATLIRDLLIPVAYAVTDTFYSGAGDGYVYGSATTWNSAHDATTGPAQPTLTVTNIGGQVSRTEVTCGEDPFPPPIYNNSFLIYRTFLPFDSSAIPASATISSASLNVYATSKLNDDNDGADYVGVVETSQATDTTLAGTDFDNNGNSVDNPTQGAAGIDFSSISIGTYTSFTLDSTGLTWIAKSGTASNCSATSGISCFGLREGHDITDAAIATPSNPAVCESSSTQNYVTISTADETGTSQDPYLSVTYTAPQSAFMISRGLFVGDGKLQILGGGLIIR